MFGLDTPNRANSRDLIRQQELARNQQKAAEKAAKRAWVRQVDQLKAQCKLYRAILDSCHCEPLLDLLCGV